MIGLLRRLIQTWRLVKDVQHEQIPGELIGSKSRKTVCLRAEDSAMAAMRSKFRPGGSYCPWTPRNATVTRRKRPKIEHTVTPMRRAQ